MEGRVAAVDGGGGLFGRTPTDVGLFAAVVLGGGMACDFDVEYLPLLPNFITRTTTTTTTTAATIRPIMSKAPMTPPAIAPAGEKYQ